MPTQVFRVSRVRVAAQSPVARLDAVDADGHELRLEAPTLTLQGVQPGRLLVLQWSVHTLPAEAQRTADPPSSPMTAPARVPASTPQAPSTAGAGAPVGTSASRSPEEVDRQFMDLMRRGRSTSAPQTAAPSQARGIEDELSTLLGPARGKGSTDGR